MSRPNPVWIYRIIHIDCLDTCLQRGGLHSPNLTPDDGLPYKFIHKEAGEPLKLNYEAGTYGPYAHNLNKVLENMEGHFTRGYGDSQRPDEEIELVPGAVKVADAFLAQHLDSKLRLTQVSQLIEGFETPYGMELLSSVHWVAKHTEIPAQSAKEAIQAIHQWNDRKRRMFHSKHIQIAWDSLVEQNWVKEVT